MHVVVGRAASYGPIPINFCSVLFTQILIITLFYTATSKPPKKLSSIESSQDGFRLIALSASAHRQYFVNYFHSE